MILTTTTSCGKVKFKSIKVEQEPELYAYAIDFSSEYYGFRGMNVPINNIAMVYVDELPNLVIGRCINNSKIEILRRFWQNSSELGKRQLMYHELGHCALKREHNNDTAPTIPHGGDNRASIMNSHTLSDSIFERNYGALIKELFTEEKLQYILE